MSKIDSTPKYTQSKNVIRALGVRIGSLPSITPYVMYRESSITPASSATNEKSSFSSTSTSFSAFAVDVGTGLASSAAHTPPQSVAAQTIVISFFVFIFPNLSLLVEFQILPDAVSNTISILFAQLL